MFWSSTVCLCSGASRSALGVSIQPKARVLVNKIIACVFFDGSSIAGWKAINQSDMLLKPDLTRPIIDPFNSHTTLNIFCDILDAVNKDPYERDPRGTAKKAEAYLKKSGIGDKSYFGPEPEFFVFDDVRFKNDMNETSFSIDSSEGPYNTGKKYENGNMGHRPGIKGGYFPVPPVDSA